jgi:hypothetical protein
MAVAPALQVEIPMASVVASNPNPSMEESVHKADLDMAVGQDPEA